ncbi:MAG: oxygenase MpaB family protein [Jatrophihabitantaceae bacterium]
MSAVEFDPRPHLQVASMMDAAANVIMQLAIRPVGRGVLESTVESGQVMRHPVKRGRTTLTYLAVAMLGTDDERALYREAVNVSHRPVHSGPDSPVRYNAFDPDLQLWVAACLYRGFLDTLAVLGREFDEPTSEAFHRFAARLGTTLQVQEDSWPADLESFWKYWDDKVADLEIDEATRAYLKKIADLTFLPRIISLPLGRLSEFVTRGLLPTPFRTAMHYPWSGRDQRRFDRLMSLVAFTNRFVPPIAQRMPYNVLLWDLRRRVKHGRPLV